MPLLTEKLIYSRLKVPLHISKLYNKKKINEPDFMDKEAVYDLDEIYSDED